MANVYNNMHKYVQKNSEAFDWNRKRVRLLRLVFSLEKQVKGESDSAKVRV